MALTFDLKPIIDREGEDAVWIKTADEGTRVVGWVECMIYATMFVGINKITEENWREFAIRLRAWETCVGMISSSGVKMSPAHVKRAIGLHTNATPMTNAGFRKRLVESVMSDATRRVDSEIKSAAEQAKVAA